jgi:OOP family OmpA-OmpF porin
MMTVSKGFAGATLLLSLAALVSTGCATKKYVQQQTGTVQQRVEEVDKKHAQALANLEGKEQKDVSRVEERAMSAENKANDAARAAQMADQKAAQAGETAQNATRMAQANQSKLNDLSTAIGNIDNFKMLQSEDVLFGFNKAVLTPEARAKLDQTAQKASSMNRYAIEVEGYTDKSGASDYNLALSRRRADVVVRYLVAQKIPLRQIHMIGLGDEKAQEAGNTREARKQQRKVVVRLFAPQS